MSLELRFRKVGDDPPKHGDLIVRLDTINAGFGFGSADFTFMRVAYAWYEYEMVERDGVLTQEYTGNSIRFTPEDPTTPEDVVLEDGTRLTYKAECGELKPADLWCYVDDVYRLLNEADPENPWELVENW